MMERLKRALSRAQYAAMGAAVGAFVGGLFSRSWASTGAATGALIGAIIGEKSHTVGTVIEDVRERGEEDDSRIDINLANLRGKQSAEAD